MSVRWRMLAVTLALSMIGLSAACNSSAEESTPAPSPSASHQASEPAGPTTYPLTLNSPYGSTVLTSAPKRVAIAGQVGDTENVMSLGVVPVLAPDFQLQWPWIDSTARGKVEKSYKGTSTSDLPLEQFAASRPDVIIATSDTKLDQHFPLLSKIAPVVALPDRQAGTQFDWQQSLRLIGKALDRSTEAEQQITATTNTIEKVNRDHPEFRGRSISFTINYGGANGRTFYNGKGSPGEALLTQLGFDPADHADSFTGERPPVSDESLPLLDSDIVVINFNAGEKAKRELEATPLFANLPAVKDGRYVALLPTQGDVSPLAWSLARPTATNLQWSIDYLIPKLVPAAKA